MLEESKDRNLRLLGCKLIKIKPPSIDIIILLLHVEVIVLILVLMFILLTKDIKTEQPIYNEEEIPRIDQQRRNVQPSKCELVSFSFNHKRSNRN